MGEETGRKSALRHAKTIIFLIVILAVSLVPAIALRLFPREALAIMFGAVSGAIESRTGIPSEGIAAVSILISFVSTTVSASALMVVLARAPTKSKRQTS